MKPPAQALAALLLGMPLATAIAAPTPRLSPKRSYGYFPGALIEADAELWLPGNMRLDLASLPVPGPVDPETDLRHIICHTSRRAHGTLVRLALTYQVFYSPQETGPAMIPGFSVMLKRDGRTMDQAIRGTSVLISPFRHDLTPSLDPSQMRPDPAPAAELRTRPWEMALAGAVLAGFSGLALLGLRLAVGAGPGAFATAYRAIRRERLDDRAARLALHRAFDATAGRRVLAQDLEQFMFEHRRFLAHGHEIRQFFAQSNAIFFAAETVSALPRGATPRALARTLARAERRPA